MKYSTIALLFVGTVMGVQRHHHHHHHEYVQVNGDGKAPRMLNCGDGLEASEANMKF